jgi:hypothetical protein
MISRSHFIQELKRYSRDYPGIAEQLLDALPDEHLRVAARAVGLRLWDVKSGLVRMPYSNIKSLLKAADRDAHTMTALRSGIRGRLREMDARMQFFECAVIDLNAFRAEASRRLDSLPTKIQASQPEIYADYQRLEAEAELRFAILPPLIAISVGSTRLLLRDLSVPSNSVAKFYVAVGLVSLLTWLGMRRKVTLSLSILDGLARHDLVQGESPYPGGLIVIRGLQDDARSRVAEHPKPNYVARSLRVGLKRQRTQQLWRQAKELRFLPMKYH